MTTGGESEAQMSGNGDGGEREKAISEGPKQWHKSKKSALMPAPKLTFKGRREGEKR